MEDRLIAVLFLFFARYSVPIIGKKGGAKDERILSKHSKGIYYISDFRTGGFTGRNWSWNRGFTILTRNESVETLALSFYLAKNSILIMRNKLLS